jgi:histidine triad (HIT) family protein
MMGTADQAGESTHWRNERIRIMTLIEGLKRQGICYICRDLETGEVFGKQHVIHEDEVYRVVLDSYPLTQGHAILTYKPHREDLASLSPPEASRIFRAIVYVTKGLEAALGAQKVYLLSMPDGASSHLVFQLVPRYEGQPMGMQLFRLERQPLKNGAEMAAKIRSLLVADREKPEQG